MWANVSRYGVYRSISKFTENVTLIPWRLNLNDDSDSLWRAELKMWQKRDFSARFFGFYIWQHYNVNRQPLKNELCILEKIPSLSIWRGKCQCSSATNWEGDKGFGWGIHRASLARLGPWKRRGLLRTCSRTRASDASCHVPVCAKFTPRNLINLHLQLFFQYIAHSLCTHFLSRLTWHPYGILNYSVMFCTAVLNSHLHVHIQLTTKLFLLLIISKPFVFF